MARYYEAEALIEFVKNNSPHINGETTLECVERAIMNAPTADVVLRSEVEKLNEEIKDFEISSADGRARLKDVQWSNFKLAK